MSNIVTQARRRYQLRLGGRCDKHKHFISSGKAKVCLDDFKPRRSNIKQRICGNCYYFNL